MTAKFKREITQFQGGEVRIAGRTHELSPQPVRIIRTIDGGDDEDLVEVEFFNLGFGKVDCYDLHPRPDDRPSNAEFMGWLVENGSPHPLSQAVIVNAVEQTCEEIIKNEDKLLVEMSGGMVSGTAWVRCAKDVLDTIKANRD
jgi:hypothetical protein